MPRLPSGSGRPPAGSGSASSIWRSRISAPTPACRSGRCRATWSIWPTNIVVTRKSVTRRGTEEVAGRRQRDGHHADPREQAVQEQPGPAGRAGSPRRAPGRTGRLHAGRQLAEAAYDVGLAEAGAQVVAAGDALLHRGRVVGPGHLLDDLAPGDLPQQGPDHHEGDGADDREEEPGRPPGQARDDPHGHGGEHRAHRVPQLAAHQRADLVGVVVDPVEHLADGLLGEHRQRLVHRGLEEVGAQLPLGPVGDPAQAVRPMVSSTAAPTTHRRAAPPAARWGRRRAGPPRRCRGSGRSRRSSRRRARRWRRRTAAVASRRAGADPPDVGGRAGRCGRPR